MKLQLRDLKDVVVYEGETQDTSDEIVISFQGKIYQFSDTEFGDSTENDLTIFKEATVRVIT